MLNSKDILRKVIYLAGIIGLVYILIRFVLPVAMKILGAFLAIFLYVIIIGIVVVLILYIIGFVFRKFNGD